MRYVCDASANATWFRIETVAEAALESDLMKHAVEKHFRAARDRAISTYAPPAGAVLRAGYWPRGVSTTRRRDNLPGRALGADPGPG